LPRAARKPAFAVDRDVEADAPTSTTTTGLLPKYDDDLPPLTSAPPVTQPPAPAAVPAERALSSTEDNDGTAAEKPKSSPRPRGTGGRPAAGKELVDTITKVPARVPGDLYAEALPLVKGVGKPSWGQLIAWTCQDHHDAVLAEVLALAADSVGSRRLRGPNREGAAALQVTARVDALELDAVDDILKRAQGKAKTKVTRTHVVIGALKVATGQPT
jgi:hypothetical protein